MNEALWSRQEFGGAKLGDPRRTDRLVAMGATAASSPGGTIAGVFEDSAEREGAFRFVENDAVNASEITLSAATATALRVGAAPFVFVPIDGSSLNIPDRDGHKRLGAVGTRKIQAQGLQVMTAIAVSDDDVPLGIAGQHFWARSKTVRNKAVKDKRTVDKKETVHWLTVMKQANDAFARHAPQTRLWFQMDRGADAWPILSTANDGLHWLTVRATWDRRLKTPDEQQRYLWESMEKTALRGTYTLDVSPSNDNKKSARQAQMHVRAAAVVLELYCERVISALLGAGIFCQGEVRRRVILSVWRGDAMKPW